MDFAAPGQTRPDLDAAQHWPKGLAPLLRTDFNSG